MHTVRSAFNKSSKDWRKLLLYFSKTATHAQRGTRLTVLSLFSDRLPQGNISTEPLSEYLPVANGQIQQDSAAISSPINQSIDQTGISSWYASSKCPWIIQQYFVNNTNQGPIIILLCSVRGGGLFDPLS